MVQVKSGNSLLINEEITINNSYIQFEFLIGDFNKKVGQEKNQKECMEHFAFGVRNYRG